jgi:hypothetical protein
VSDITKVYSPGGQYFSVANQHAPRFTSFLKDLHDSGYPIHQNQSGGYNYRNIAGTNKLSNHAHGSAIDLNWSLNPRSKSNPYGHIGETLGADKFRALVAKHGLSWGGDWKNPDAMHVEVAGGDGHTHNHTQVQPNPTGPAFGSPRAAQEMGIPGSSYEINKASQIGAPPGSARAAQEIGIGGSTYETARAKPSGGPAGAQWGFNGADHKITWGDGSTNMLGPGGGGNQAADVNKPPKFGGPAAMPLTPGPTSAQPNQVAFNPFKSLFGG